MSRHPRVIGLVAAFALLSGCGTKEAPTTITSGDQGRVRFVNLITNPAVVPVDAVLEALPFGVNLAYGAATPPTLPAPATALYSPILTGSRTLVVKRTAVPTVTLATITFTVNKDEDRTIYATGGTGGAAATSFSTVDVNTAPAVTDTRFRIVNLSPTTGAVDVFLTANNADLTGATPNATNIAVQGNAYFSLVAGTYQIRMVPALTAPAARNASVVITVASAAYGAGAARTIVAADNAAGAGAARGVILTDR